MFDWAALMVNRGCETLAYMYAVPNGGKRFKKTAVKLRREGVKAGVPDICLPVPAGDYHGLYIEMKYGKNSPTKLQKNFIDYLKGAGYRVEVCYSFEQARDVILDHTGFTDLTEASIY